MTIGRVIMVPILIAILILFYVGTQSRIDVPLGASARVLAVQADSRLLGIGDLSGRVLLWDLKSKKPVREFDRSKHGEYDPSKNAGSVPGSWFRGLDPGNWTRPSP